MTKKKNWIMVKRGLIVEPKHRVALGVFVWLYLHIIDRCDWETGVVLEWRDEIEANEMLMPVRTLRYQRRKLQELGYITAQQGQGKQTITVHRWVNPRNYSGEVLNVTGDTDTERWPLKSSNHGGKPLQPEGDNHGDNHGSYQGGVNVVTSSISDQGSSNQGSTVVPEPENRKKTASSDWPEKSKPLVEAYVSWINGDPGESEKIDSRAVDWLAQNYTVAQVKIVYDQMKLDPFWSARRIKPRHLFDRVPEYFATQQRAESNAVPAGVTVYT